MASKHAAFALQNVKKVNPQNAFSELRRHLTRATVTFDYAFKDYTDEQKKLREDEPTRIDKEEPYQALMFDETEADDEQSEAQQMLLQEYAATFCRDGERWI